MSFLYVWRFILVHIRCTSYLFFQPSVATNKFLLHGTYFMHFVLVLLEVCLNMHQIFKWLKLASNQPCRAFSINNWRINHNTIHSLVQLFDSLYKGFSPLSSRPLYLSQATLRAQNNVTNNYAYLLSSHQRNHQWHLAWYDMFLASSVVPR